MGGAPTDRLGHSLTPVAQQVLRQYPLPGIRSLRSFTSPVSFSGAALWRVESLAGPFCLRAWPRQACSLEHHEEVVRLQIAARSANLAFVPEVWRTREQKAHVCAADHIWRLETWLPGTSVAEASPEQMAAACQAIGQLHDAWAQVGHARDICPGVLRRLERLREWQTLIGLGWSPLFRPEDEPSLTAAAQEVWTLLPRCTRLVSELLSPWITRKVLLHACHCDVWWGNILLEGASVSGIVDYSSAKLDSPCVDLARLLGSWGEDDSHYRSGLASYAEMRPLGGDAEDLIRVLDITGCVIAATNWLRWVYHERRAYPDPLAISDRLVGLARRLRTVT